MAVEFPEARIDGDEGRIVDESVGGGTCRIISGEDLYLDRVGQATASSRAQADTSFHSALAVAAALHDVLDWDYVRSRIKETLAADPPLGEPMRRIDRLVRNRVRRALAGPG